MALGPADDGTKEVTSFLLACRRWASPADLRVHRFCQVLIAGLSSTQGAAPELYSFR